jgi:hypothetical protein
MKRYPLLRQATEELLTQYLREREVITKHACSAYVQTQLAYINTNNEDFIGFARFVLFLIRSTEANLTRQDISYHNDIAF